MQGAVLPWALLTFASSALAAYDQFFFSTEEGDWLCPGLIFDCPPPRVCAYDRVLDKSYCCGPGEDEVCWTGRSMLCQTGTTQCGDENNPYCCLEERETCTQRYGQINICWSTLENPFEVVTAEQVNDTFYSLLEENPSATSIEFDLDLLVPESTTTAESTSAATTTADPTSTTEATTTAAATTTDDATATGDPTSTSVPPAGDDSDSDSGSSLSGGAIAGIVVGSVAGVALIAGVAFFLWKRNRANRAGLPMDNGGYGGKPPMYAYGSGPVHEVYAPPPEMDGTTPREVEGDKPPERDNNNNNN
ncbi:hypothetical protein VTO42DRAFT_2794 [Malbranchea cinnamomea]